MIERRPTKDEPLASCPGRFPNLNVMAKTGGSKHWFCFHWYLHQHQASRYEEASQMESSATLNFQCRSLSACQRSTILRLSIPCWAGIYFGQADEDGAPDTYVSLRSALLLFFCSLRTAPEVRRHSFTFHYGGSLRVR